MVGKRQVNAGFHHLFHMGISKEMLEVSSYQLLQNIGKNMVALVLPYYLYAELGYSVPQIVYFYFLWQISFLIVSPFAGTVIRMVGLKHAISLRAIGGALLWGLLPFLLQGDFQSDMLRIAPLFLFRALFTFSSEVAYDIFLTHHVSKEAKGKTLAYIQVAIMLSAFLAPIAGGLITYFWGFEYVARLALLFFISAAAVLLLTPDMKVKIPYKPKTIVKDLIKKVPRELYFSEFGRCFFDTVMWVFWPLFLVLILKDIRSIGAIAGIASAVSMIVAIMVGKQMDKPSVKKSSPVLRMGAIRSALINALRGFLPDPISLTIADVLHKVNQQTVSVPYDYDFYHWMKSHNSIERSHLRWMIGENVYTLILGIAALVFFYFPEPTDPIGYKPIFVGIFILSALSMMLCRFVSDLKG